MIVTFLIVTQVRRCDFKGLGATAQRNAGNSREMQIVNRRPNPDPNDFLSGHKSVFIIFFI